MPRPRQVTDEQILATTRACVLDLGPHVSLDAVAERLGVTAPALLKRFGSRQRLFLEALRPPVEAPFRRLLEETPDPATPFEAQLEPLLRAMLDFFQEMVPRISALRESGIAHTKVHEGRGSPVDGIRAMTRWLEAAAAAGLIEVEAPESAATAMLGSITARAFTAHWTKHAYSTRSNREYLKDITQLFCRALSVSTAPRRRRPVRSRGGRAAPHTSLESP